VDATFALAPGSALEGLELLADGRPIWSGEAVVVHGSSGRIGCRFTSGLLDLNHLRLGATLDERLALLDRQRELLPADWRAAVADLRQLLDDLKFEMDGVERWAEHDPLRARQDETDLFRSLLARWGSAYYQATAHLYEMSKTLDKNAVALGKSYAASLLMPLLVACPFHRRAYEKPLGYAGDYRMMELLFTRELGGEGLFGRFLHSIAQNYTLARAVLGREVVMRHAVRAAIESKGEGPVRVLALAAGPAIELRRALEETSTLSRPVELILLDQDLSAHETAHRHLTRILLEQHRGALPATVTCLHFSVRQLLRPQTPHDLHVVHETLANLDLVYAAGLFDYLPEPVARSLAALLHGRLKPGGRLLLGNLVAAPDTTWVMDYVWLWPLIYRTDETMLRLAEGLPGVASITRDETGSCIFLDVTKSPSR
jgi:extracellular factor (EF) 3-hydroxypalmitic acid methyl ester biosynthesis protein